MFVFWSADSNNQTIWKPDKKVSERSNVWISGVWYSDGYCVHEACFIPALLFWSFNHSRFGCSDPARCIFIHPFTHPFPSMDIPPGSQKVFLSFSGIWVSFFGFWGPFWGPCRSGSSITLPLPRKKSCTVIANPCFREFLLAI